MLASPPPSPAVAAALAELAFWRRRIVAARAWPALTTEDARRLAAARRRAADIRAWLRPPGIGREPLPASLGRADIAAGAAYLRHLRTPPENASPDPLGRRLRPNAPGTEGTPPPALAAAAFLARHAPSDAHPDHAWRAVRTAYPLRQPIAQAILRWSERYAELLLEQNMN